MIYSTGVDNTKECGERISAPPAYIVNGAWTDGNFNIYVGNYFAGLSAGAQLSVLVHETIHAATTGKINQWMVDLQTATVPGMGSPRFGNIYAIAKNCGTSLPPGY